MSKILNHFTTVGDDYKKWQEEEEDDEILPETEHHPPPPQQESLSFRNALKQLLSSHKFQVAVVCLVICDAVFVLCELLIDLAIISADKYRIIPQVFHYTSMAILTFFVIEIFGKVYAYRLEFFHHKFEVFDAAVVIISFILDIIFASREDIFNAVGLLILLRLWRVARIVNGIVLSVKSQAKQKISEFKEANERLQQSVNELRHQCTQQDQEIKRLHTLLEQHGISYKLN